MKLESALKALAGLIKGLEETGEVAEVNSENAEVDGQLPPPPATGQRQTVKEAMQELAEETQHLYEQLVMFKIKPLFDRIKMYEHYMGEEQQSAPQQQHGGFS